jgi:glucose/arabinose dehydrogenase
MSSMHVRLVLIGLMVCSAGAAGGGCDAVAPAPVLPINPEVSLPAGFVMNEFATGLSGPRFMALGPNGIVLVAERAASRVVALADADNNGAADSVVEVLADLHAPSSLALREGKLYVGETTRVTRVDLAADLSVSNRTAIIDGIPDGGHATRTVCFGSDGRLYVSVGSSCNVCEEGDVRRAAINSYLPDGSDWRLFATGLRNAVGLAVEGQTGVLWASNNMGDDVPAETIYAVHEGDDAGWPRCHAGTVQDPVFGLVGGCDGVLQPVVRMQAHMAPLGIAFYDGNQFPEEFRGDLFVALHGSWNRSTPVGYKVMRVPIEGGMAAGPAVDFAEGWLRDDNTTTGRPTGVLVAADGALLVSDDTTGTIYRIAYTGP